ncbi:MAG TPA: MlaD family protein, partial [bacterium]
MTNELKITPEFKVGLMTTAALLILMFAILFLTNFSLTGQGNVVRVAFNFLGDLRTNAPVKYAGGIDVGVVKDIRIDQDRAVAYLLITHKNFKLRKDSKIAIYSAGLLGAKYVQIESDLGTGDELKPEDILEGHDSNNLDKTFSQLGDVMENFEAMMGDPKAKESFLHSFENMNKATDQLLALSISSREKVEKILADLSKSSANVGPLVDSAEKVSKSLEGLTGALN